MTFGHGGTDSPRHTFDSFRSIDIPLLEVFTMSPIRCLGCVRSIQKGGLPPLMADDLGSALKSLTRSLSFTPGFSLVTRWSRKTQNRFNGLHFPDKTRKLEHRELHAQPHQKPL